MKKVEVLVATMNAKDFSKVAEMNLQTDVVFANQADETSYKECNIGGCAAKMITTADRGVGKNRNHAIMYASQPYLLFADDDMRYYDGYEALVNKAFDDCPKADMIIFDLDYSNTTTGIKKKKIKEIKRLHWYNSLKYGAARMAVKRDSLMKANVWFSTLYGGGAEHCSGEDSLFIVQALKRGMKIYAYPADIANVKQESSSWFRGFNEKYFTDKGFLLANMFPRICGLLCVYYAYSFRNANPDFSMMKVYKLLKSGVKDFKK